MGEGRLGVAHVAASSNLSQRRAAVFKRRLESMPDAPTALSPQGTLEECQVLAA
jgi:hypothetical protein